MIDRIELPRGFRLALCSSIDEARDAWTRIESSSSPYPFQRLPWLETWQETIGKANGYSPAVGIIEDLSGAALCLLPMGYRGRGSSRRLEWMGWGVSDYSGPLLSPDSGIDGALIKAAVFAIGRSLGCSLILLERNPERLCGGPNPLLGEGLRELHYGSHYAQVPKELGAFMKERFGAKGSYNLRRAERRLSELGKLEFAVARDADSRSKITEAMIRHKRERYREQKVRDNFDDPSFASFYEGYSRQGGSKAHLSALYLDGRSIAEHWGLVDGSTMYLLMPTFEAGKLDAYSPGSILIERLFGLCIEEGLGTLDFTAGDEEYKDRWCEGRMRLYRRAYGIGPIGKIMAFAIEAMEGLKKGPLLETGRAVKKFIFSRRYRSR